jgi:hypothetical protein
VSASGPGRGDSDERLPACDGYKNRFIYLFGEGLEKLKTCLDAWSFMLPKNKDRIIIGRTAYGALFCLENANTPGQMKRVYVLDPLNLEYFGDENLDVALRSGRQEERRVSRPRRDSGVQEAGAVRR